jgi:outer membrane protein assembly factor BamB
MYGIAAIVFCGCGNTPLSGGGENAVDWPLFRGDAGLSGYSNIRLTDAPELIWSYKSDARTSSSPVIYRQTVYWSDKRGRIYGINRDGDLAFDYDFATAVEATPMVSDSVLYIGRIDGIMSAVSLNTRDTLWNFETMGQISASPNTGIFRNIEVVVFGSYDNYLYCLDKRDGRAVGRFASGYYINGAVAIRQSCFISGGCDAWLRIIDGASGLQTDSIKLETYIPASPAIDGRFCYVADHSGNVYEIVIEDGRIAGSRKMFAAADADGTFVSVPALSPSTLYILSDDRHLYAIDRGTGRVRWKYLQKGQSGESSPLVCTDKIIACTKTGIVSLVDASTGALLWEYDTGEPVTASPAVVKGRFYILTNRGTLFCFGAE